MNCISIAMYKSNKVFKWQWSCAFIVIYGLSTTTTLISKLWSCFQSSIEFRWQGSCILRVKLGLLVRVSLFSILWRYFHINNMFNLQWTFISTVMYAAVPTIFWAFFVKSRRSQRAIMVETFLFWSAVFVFSG